MTDSTENLGNSKDRLGEEALFSTKPVPHIREKRGHGLQIQFPIPLSSPQILSFYKKLIILIISYVGIRFSMDTSVGPKPSFSSKSEGEPLKSSFFPATSPPAPCQCLKDKKETDQKNLIRQLPVLCYNLCFKTVSPGEDGHPRLDQSKEAHDEMNPKIFEQSPSPTQPLYSLSVRADF